MLINFNDLFETLSYLYHQPTPSWGNKSYDNNTCSTRGHIKRQWRKDGLMFQPELASNQESVERCHCCDADSFPNKVKYYHAHGFN